MRFAEDHWENEGLVPFSVISCGSPSKPEAWFARPAQLVSQKTIIVILIDHAKTVQADQGCLDTEKTLGSAVRRPP